MESSYHCMTLLIEPIWNRNAKAAVPEAEMGDLLIEPIWNRNDGTKHPTRDFDSSFNRTNLE